MYMYQWCPIEDIHGCILIFISELLVEYHYTSPHQDYMYITIHHKESHKDSFSAYTGKYYELNTTTQALPHAGSHDPQADSPGPHKDYFSVVTEAIGMNIPVAVVEGAAGAVGGAAVRGVLQIVNNLYQRCASLKPNEKQRDDICRKVTTLQKILQRAMETAVDTRDALTKQSLSYLQQKLTKCVEICGEIERRSLAAKFWNAPDDVKRVQELSHLLDESIFIATFYFTVSIYNALPAIQQRMRHVEELVRYPQAGVYPLDSECQNKPEKVEKPTVKEVKPGVLDVCWRKISADYYELEYDRQNRSSLPFDSNNCELDSAQVKFPNEISYKIRVRGVNGRGPGEWSETAVGMFTVLPEQPHKPIAVYVNSATSITLVVKKPVGREGAKPVTLFVVEYHTENNREMTRRIFPVDNLEMVRINGMDTFKINLNCDTASIYFVQISHSNKDGDSLPCEDTIIVDRIPPGEPVGLTVVHTTTHTIIIEWSKPETNEYMVDHYKVQWGRNGHITKTKTTKKCYAVFRKLETRREYLFKVKAVNKMGYGSESIEIRAKTQSMTAKVAMALIMGAAWGALSIGSIPYSPAIAATAAGVGAGMAAAERVQNKGKAAEVAAGTAAGIAGGIAGLLATPIVIVASPFVGTAAGITSVISDDEDRLEHYLDRYPDDSNNPDDYDDPNDHKDD